MKLRPENVLFLDDEPSNLQRALAIDESLMCGSIGELQGILLQEVESLPADADLSRLKRYRELQNKSESKKRFSSDSAFLEQSDIKVLIKNDCLDHIDRIHELINRTNQLNFTKKRLERSETEALLKGERIKCGYIECTDKYSDYGIVGFFALDQNNNELIHFLFSCRTIGMGVEQFVYAKIGFPKLKTVGNIVTQLDDTTVPYWINNSHIKKQDLKKKSGETVRILVKGPCDVSKIAPYFIGGEFCEEFAYTSEQKKGIFIESFNHTSQVLYSKELADDKKDFLRNHVPFVDDEYFSTKIFSEEFDYVIFSMLTDYSLGLYQCVSQPELIVPFGQYTIDYTKKEEWERIQKVLTGNQGMGESQEKEYEFFSKEFKYLGIIPDEELIKNLSGIREYLPDKTKLILLNGAEKKYPGVCKPSHLDRHLLHQRLNRLVDDFAANYADNCFVIDVNRFLNGDNPYLDTINHYKPEIYYHIAYEIQQLINRTSATTIKTKSHNTIIFEKTVSKLKRRVKTILGK